MSVNPIRSLLARDQASIMGIINTTPDSFSDGGQFLNTDLAVRHGLALIEQGADILDVGGESTRPGADKVAAQQELDRVIPVIENLAKQADVPISIDTVKPEVMREAVSAGASLINDVNGLRAPGAIDVVADKGVPVCIMHMQGNPQTMQAQPQYADVVAEVMDFFKTQIQSCEQAGVERADIILDPGIGFGKTLAHNLSLLKAVASLRNELSCEVLIGVSRKSMFAKLLERDVDQRLPASLGIAVQAVLNGAKIVRVHDVRETVDAIRSVEAVMNAQ